MEWLYYRGLAAGTFLCFALLFSLTPRQARATSDAELGEMFSEIDERVTSPGERTEKGEISELSPPVTDLLESHQKRKFSGWGSYTREFKDLCSALAADGREQQLKQISDRFLIREVSCPACYPLMKIVSRACAPKKVPKAKKDKKGERKDAEEESAAEEGQVEAVPVVAEPVVALPVRQREPHMKVEVFLEALLMRLAQDDSRRDEGMIALKRFSERLVAKEYQQLPGERDYFRQIQATMDAVLEQQEIFRARHERQAEVDQGIHIGSESKESVNDLFDYE